MEAMTETKFGTKVAYGMRMMPELFVKYSLHELSETSIVK